MNTRDRASQPPQGPSAAAARSTSAPFRPVVTVAAFYGAGGTVVGPQVAERLGVAFLDRGILTGVAERMQVSEDVVAAYEQPQSRIGRYFESLARAPGPDGTPMDDLNAEERRYRAETEEFLARATASGGVVLGRGGAVVLHSVPGVLHVMLSGPREARVHQAMKLEGIDQQTAQRRLEANDRARIEWVSRSYGVDPLGPDLYHLRIDRTAVDLLTCVDLIVAASRSRIHQVAGTTQQ